MQKFFFISQEKLSMKTLVRNVNQLFIAFVVDHTNGKNNKMNNSTKKKNMPDPEKFQEFIYRINSEPNFPESLSNNFLNSFFLVKFTFSSCYLLTDQVLLERYLQINGNNVDNAFRLLKHSLEMRLKAPYLFENRNFDSIEIQNACATLYVVFFD